MAMADSADPADDFSALWHNGRRPDLDAFVAAARSLSPRQLADLLCIDLRERWHAGERIPVENYFQRYPQVRSDPDLALDLVYGELLLHEEDDGTVDEMQLSQRFPDLAETLRAQAELHRAMTPREPAASADPMPRHFGRYEIQRQLGRGGMGTVYLARDSQLNRLVALKVPNLADDPALARQFVREARAAAALQHPNICPVYDSGEIDGRHFITMAYLEGEPLSTQIQRGPLPVIDAVKLARTLADALEEAHRAGIVHRDLKPANILHNAKGQPVITDFGLSRRMTALSVDSLSGQDIIGTPAYMAPEQVNGDTKAIGPATDIYALGVVLYEMLTATRPFDGPLGSLLARIVTDDPEPPARRRPEVDSRLSAICRKALAKKPSSRYPTMAAFAAALDAWMAITSERPSRPPRSSRRVAIAVAIGAVVLAGGVLIWQPWKGRPNNNPDRPQPPPVATLRDPVAAQKIADRAWVLNDSDMVDRAIEECHKALILDDQCVSALMCRANARIKKKDFDPAIADLQLAASLEPNNEMPYVDLAWATNEMGQHDKAIAHADRALVLKKDSAEAFNQRGWAYFNQKKYREAVADFTIAIEHDREFVSAYQHRALAYKELGEDGKAKMDETKAEELAKAKKP
jgi:tetratricopeptide (TPR) repeat protein/predicted Ser/Thr protein kinase